MNRIQTLVTLCLTAALLTACGARTSVPSVPTETPETTEAGPGLYQEEYETQDISLGIDVARYQGTIDWAQVAADGIDFAMVRVGYRAQEDGQIVADSNALYNLQQASRQGIALGVYFFSTAVTAEEAREEANWVADFISQYPITYPVVYNCEGFTDPNSRQYSLTKAQRTDLALEFLYTVYTRGYTPMFYASQSDLQDSWETGRIDGTYRIWVAQYPAEPYPHTVRSDYSGTYSMWQYSHTGTVAGIEGNVDMNVAWFSYSQLAQPQDPTTPVEAKPDPEAMMEFTAVRDSVTAKEQTNLRDLPSQGEESTVMMTLPNGQWVTRTGVSDSGWSRLEIDGTVYYAVTSYLTDDPNYAVQPPEEEDDGIKTVFTSVNDRVTAKEVVNLRSIPSVTREDSVVVAQLTKGEVIARTGVNNDVGWSRVEYNGQVLYCITSYLEVVEDAP